MFLFANSKQCCLFINSNLHPVLLPSDVFDQTQPVGNKKIEFHISTDMPAGLEKDLEKEQNFEEQNSGKYTLFYFFKVYIKLLVQIFILELKFTNFVHFNVC